MSSFNLTGVSFSINLLLWALQAPSKTEEP